MSSHRASLATLPRTRSVDTFTPKTPGARHVVFDAQRDRLVFVARGHLASEARAGGEAQVLASGHVDSVWSQPSVVGDRIVGLRVDTRAAPAVPRMLEVVGGASVPAHAYGVSATGTVVAVDVVKGDVRTLDVTTGNVVSITQLETHQDPQRPGLVSVDDAGHALLTLSSFTHGHAWLVEIDLAAGTARAVHAPVVNGAVSGCFWKGKLLVAEQHLGDAPGLRVLYDGKLVLEREGLHPHAGVLPLSDQHVVLLLAQNLDALTHTGEPHLCALDVRGHVAPLAPAEGARIRRDSAGAVFVEGGRAVTRVRLA